MLTKNINFKNFKIKKTNKKIKDDLNILLKENNTVLQSLKTSYKNSYQKKIISRFKKYLDIRVIGMGGSILGTEAINNFLKNKIKKNFLFIDNLQASNKTDKKNNFTNLVISKSGNTIETIVNTNILVKKKDKNIFITEKKDSYLYLLAEKLKADIIHHNNFIGGRY